MDLAQAAVRYLTGGLLGHANPPKSDPAYWVVPGLLAGRAGPECVPWNVADFVDMGIGGIISLDGPIRTRDLASAGLVHLPLYQPMLLLHTEEDHKRFLNVMRPVLRFVDARQSQGTATLVHCYYGCDRTGTVLACYLVARCRCPAAEAVSRVQKINPNAMWAIGYMEAVQTFERLYLQDPSQFEDGSD